MHTMARQGVGGTNMAPLTVSVETAAQMLGVSRRLGYELARTGRIPVLRLGKRLVVPRAQLLAMLGLRDPLPGDESEHN